VSGGDDVAERLLAWGLSRMRDLPWRHTADRWRILVSEVMLQQTQATRVVPKYEEFVSLAPTPAACVALPLADLLRVWQGLGYPRRCRNLQEAARVVVERHGGEVPATVEELLELPGVGPYTARAVVAFSGAGDAACVDTNIARVLARLAGRAMSAREVQRAADDALPSGLARDWNQVLMDFGASVCSARTPRCGECPVADRCAWRGVGDDPARATAFTSRPQSRFDGSDRQARGRLLRALAERSLPESRAAEAMGLVDDERVARLVCSLVADGLVTRSGSRLGLPDGQPIDG
jgi:A/G-specific adenine glycosylase